MVGYVMKQCKKRVSRIWRSAGFIAIGFMLAHSNMTYADNAVPANSTGTVSSPADFDLGRMNIMEENDYFGSHDDRHYTQGGRISYLSTPVTSGGAWDQPFAFLADNLPVFNGSDRKRKYEWTVAGQSIFTPTNVLTATPSPHDRPYAAWLYTGASLLQETNQGNYHTLENIELLAGIVVPQLWVA